LKTLHIEPLTREAFAPFGDVIEMEGHQPSPMNYGMAERFHALAEVEALGDDARAIISMVKSSQYALPHTVDIMERHPQGSQAFVPLDETPFIVIVAPPDDELNPSAIQAFRSNGRQGINYHRGVWHCPLLTPFAQMNFILVERAGSGNNCDEVRLDTGQQYLLEQVDQGLLTGP
jgi:ureidoglycolate lyase